MKNMDNQTYRKEKIEGITKKVLELKELNQRAIEALLSNDINRFFLIYRNFYKIRDELNHDLHGYGMLEINNKDARSILNKLSSNETLEAENFYKKLVEIMNEQTIMKDEEPFIDNYLFDKALDWFHANFDVLDIFVRRFSFGPIALESRGYDLINSYIVEAFECYAFGSYNALFALCRTVIEAVMLDICNRKELIKNVDCRDILPSTLRNMTSIKGSSLNKKLNRLYGKCSKVIHGKITRGEEESKEILKETIHIVKELYKFNNLL